MTYLRYMLLGLVQGLTEFLPVSSSGHLAIFKNIFGGDAVNIPISFDIMLHLGTLVAVFCVYYKDIFELIKEFFCMIWDLLRGKPDFSSPYRRFVIMVIIGTIPAGVAGILFKDAIENLPLWVVGICLFVTAALLYISDKIAKGSKTMENASYKSSFAVGLFQAVALLPGISRSGSTITGSLFMGYKRSFAVKFSFILSIPAILGAALIDSLDVIEAGTLGIPVIPALLGTLVSAISGFLAIRFLLRLVKSDKFHYFSYYCIVAGIFTLILNFI